VASWLTWQLKQEVLNVYARSVQSSSSSVTPSKWRTALPAVENHSFRFMS
jgi:hypothetical protein